MAKDQRIANRLKMNSMQSVRRKGLVHVFDELGHRRAYQDLLAVLLDLQPETGSITPARLYKMLKAPRLLFATIGPGTSRGALLVCLARAVAGRKTCAICMDHDWYAIRGRVMSNFLSFQLFRVLSRTRRLTVLSIIPHFLRPTLRESTTDWIYDPQLWDLSDYERQCAQRRTELSERVRSIARGRKIIVYLGKAAARKGFDELAGLSESLCGEALIVSAGLVPKDCRVFADDLKRKGMLVEDRRVTNAELLSLYGCADYVWCKYAPSNEKSSGIFGRSYQLGKVAIVREGSYLDILARHIKHPTAYCTGSGLSDIALYTADPALPADEKFAAPNMALHSVAVLENSLE